jgi:phage baseplate assembly protein gpV
MQPETRLVPVGQQSNADVATDWATLQFAIRQLLGRTATCTIVKVVACSNAGGVSPVGTVDVQPVIQMRAGDGSLWNHGQLYRLPYIRLQGGTNAVILDPQAGDLGLAWFASRDISVAKSTAGKAQLQGSAIGVAPGSERQFDMSDGLYMGGLLNGAPAQYIRFTASGVTVLSPSKVTIQAPTIELKGAVVQTDGDVSMSATLTVATDVVGGGIHLKTHTHSGVTAGGGTSGPPTP